MVIFGAKDVFLLMFKWCFGVSVGFGCVFVDV